MKRNYERENVGESGWEKVNEEWKGIKFLKYVYERKKGERVVANGRKNAKETEERIKRENKEKERGGGDREIREEKNYAR